MAPTDVVSWLLDTDPSLRWQVERDLLDQPPEVWEATRARIPHEGFGARLLDHQDPEIPLNVVTGSPARLPEGPRVAVKNSFGFGGHNAVAVFRSV